MEEIIEYGSKSSENASEVLFDGLDELLMERLKNE